MIKTLVFCLGSEIILGIWYKLIVRKEKKDGRIAGMLLNCNDNDTFYNCADSSFNKETIKRKH